MEAFFFFPLYLLPLLLLPISLYLVSFRRDQKNLPPGSKGWPLLGENLAFGLFLGPEKFVKDRMRKHSPEVFQTSLLGEKMAIFCGAQGNKFLFANENKVLISWWPQSVNKALMFPELTDINSKGFAALKRTFHHDMLKPEALKHYIPVMDASARDHIDNEWNPNSVVRVWPSSKKYTFELTCRLFMSVVDPVHIKKLFDPFALVSNGIVSVPVDLPGTAYNGAVKGGRVARAELMNIIRRRRKELMEGGGEGRSDMLSKMVVARDEDGQLFNEMELCSCIVGLMVASFETTSSAITAVMNYLAQFPHIYDEVYKEQMAIAKSKGPDDLLTWDDVEKMKYSWNVARESMRLMPPSQGAFREATADITYAGFTIPKGWKTFWTVHSSHKNPKYFPEPEKFDPTRFEGRGPEPYTFVPFGGGARMCPGKEYARLQILVFMHNVVTRFKLEKAIPNEKIVFYASPTPVHGLPIHLHPHKI